MFEVRETPRTARTNGYVQISAQRANGDKVFITADDRGEAETIRRLLMKVARRSAFRMLEIAQMAEAIAIIQANLNAPDQVLGVAPAPHPASEINEGVAWEQFLADVERTTAILEDEETGIDVIAWIADWHAGWCRFWSLRHPDPTMRASFAATLTYNLSTQQPKIRTIMRGRLDG